MNRFLRSVCFLLTLFLVVVGFDSTTWGQDDSTNLLVNGDFETVQDDQPANWFFVSQQGGSIDMVDDTASGQQAVRIDSLQATGQRFTNLMQTVDASSLQGKTIRFRAHVKTEQLKSSTRVQLWLRVDRKPDDDGNPQMGAFDNMQDRPIKSTQWEPFEIVAKVDDDAQKIVVGIFVIGQGIAFLDDATLEIVDDETAPTAKTIDTSQQQAAANQIPPEIREALASAADAPQQSFWTYWLWLVLIALTLFVFSGLPARQQTTTDLSSATDEATSPDKADSSGPELNVISKFAVRFSLVYWLLYALPSPFIEVLPQSSTIRKGFSSVTQTMVQFTAETVFGFQEKLVPPNGSGDTTHNYIEVFIWFVLALIIALVWSLIDRRKTDLRITKDLLVSYLRYVLAFTMLGYGLAKVAWDHNQFPALSDYQLNKTWGESSPMNVVWSWMGSSRSYTVFAGLGEVIAGLLLVWRRTSTLGALVAFGVMVNVFMLNMCYDVPVKLFSFHLIVMALLIMTPDIGRLASVLFLNRPTIPRDWIPPYARRLEVLWICRTIKIALILFGILIPLWSHTQRQINHFDEQTVVEEPTEDAPLLVRRGFRWINEVPFNR
ncbi:MAG: hypothetical protein AAFN77_14105 [Planctomycetota bacterium]